MALKVITDLVLVGCVEHRLPHLALPGPILGLEEGLGAELGHRGLVLLVLLQTGRESHLPRAANVENCR